MKIVIYKMFSYSYSYIYITYIFLYKYIIYSRVIFVCKNTSSRISYLLSFFIFFYILLFEFPIMLGIVTVIRRVSGINKCTKDFLLTLSLGSVSIVL